jgi:membrane protein required for colicin V production
MAIFNLQTKLTEMNYIDLFIIILLIYAVFQGFTRGLIMQLTLLAALLLGIFGALKLSGFTARQLENHINLNPEFMYLVSLGLTFILVFVAINLLGKLVEKLIEAVELSFINRLLGIVFSLCKIVLILGILLAYIDRIDQQAHFLPKDTREHSIFFKPFTTIARALFPALGKPKPIGEEQSGDIV